MDTRERGRHMGTKESESLEEHVQKFCHLAGKHPAKRCPLAIWWFHCQLQ